MIQRIKSALKKLAFCWRVAGSVRDFLRLLWYTKKYRWSKRYPDKKSPHKSPVKYRICYHKKHFAVFLRTYSGDIDIFYEIFLNGVYNFAAVKEPRVIVDLGANIGLATLYFVSKFPSADVFSIEPLPQNVNVCKLNFAQEMCSGVRIIEAAISDHNSDVWISAPKLMYNAKIVSPENSSGESGLKVCGKSMDSLLQENDIGKIDILKIDIEGAELNLFKGDTTWLSRVNQVVLELHSESAHRLVADILNKDFVMQQQDIQKPKDLAYWIKRRPE